jgi:SAM-dependent methyltransferase
VLPRLLHRLHTAGLARTVFRAWNAAAFHLGELRPERRRARAELYRRHRDFDRLHGVDTAGLIPLRSPLWRESVAYLPVDEDHFTEALAVLQSQAEPLERFTFVDLGSGKGKALLLAGELPFARIVGVEFSEALHRQALRNVARSPHARRIVARCDDATRYHLPDDPLVLFLFNPFGEEVMRPLLERVLAWTRTHALPLYVVYVRPRLSALWQQAGFEMLAQKREWAVLRWPRPQA